MSRRIVMVSVLNVALALIAGIAIAQQPLGSEAKQKGGKGAKATRAPLLFREEWKQTPAGGEHAAVPAESVGNSSLELKLYGPSSKEIQLTGAPGDENNPTHLWTGLCTTPCAAALRDKINYADLTGLARIRWVTKVSGFHAVRPMIKLADGTWLVGDHSDGSTVDWHDDEFSVAEVRWRKLDIERVVTVGDWVERPDLTKVDEIGFADLMPSSGHGQGGWIDVGRIEVYGKPAPRK